jgi:uncharacterized protein (TIGR03000 family)
VAPPAEKVAQPKPEEKEMKPEPKEGEKKEEKKEVLAPNVGRLVVSVPAEAQLFIDGQLMKTTSERRVFRTPTLEPGARYYYDLRAEIVIGGKTESETVRVIVQGGNEAEATFPKLLAAVQAPKEVAGK